MAEKRMAAISKAAKERKMRERIEAEERDAASEFGAVDMGCQVNNGWIVGVTGIVIDPGSLYYMRR